ncbi:uncharacterized protein LOC143469212 isoform X1 [Clavelina lepadiformis]|uniref:uncharacterized protein LOC143469212 isoform X1 n=1 Tax=Clavelina lepadiformis TaxID=159417 RepID=UPI0040423BD3
MAEDKQQINIPLDFVVNKEDKKSKSVRAPPTEANQQCCDQPDVSQITSSMRDVNVSRETFHRCHEQPSVPGITSSERDVNISEVPRGQCNFRFMEIFTVNDPKEEYFSFMRRRKYDQAHEVVHRQHISGSLGLQANHLRKYHKILLLSGQSEQAAHARCMMMRLIVENIEVTASEIKKFAHQLLQSDKFLDAMLFYSIAAVFYKSTSPSIKRFKKIDTCLFQMSQCIKLFLVVETEVIEGMKKSYFAMLEAEENLRYLVTRQLIPMIAEKKDLIQISHDVTKEQRCLYVTSCAHRVEYCYGLVDDYESRIQTIKTMLNLLDQCFGPRKTVYNIVGVLLNNLATTYFYSWQLQDAFECYKQALIAYNEAVDYSNSELRILQNEVTETNLQKVRTAILRSAK